MFRTARWWGEKNRIKATFKLQFQATQVPHPGWDTLMVSLIPLDSGKPTAKSEIAAVQDGGCRWDHPVYETVKLSRDPRTGKIHNKIYRILVLTGPLKGKVLGEIAIDLSAYAEAVKPAFFSLPLKAATSRVVLHVTVQRTASSVCRRDEETGDIIIQPHGKTLLSQLSNDDDNGEEADNDPSDKSVPDNSSITDQIQSLNASPLQFAYASGICRASNGTDVVSASNLHNKSKENILEDNCIRDITSFPASPSNNITLDSADHWTSATEWSASSGHDESTNDSLNSSTNTLANWRSPESATSMKHKKDLIVLAREAEVSKLELQTLRKQIMKESRKGQDLMKEVYSLKEERDALKTECEQLKRSQQNQMMKCSEDGDVHYTLEEMNQELNYEKDLNISLRLQLQKTQESNTQLMLAVRDLEELLDKRQKEMASDYLKLEVNNLQRNSPEITESKSSREEHDREQHALQKLIKEHSEVNMNNSLKQKLVGIYSEMEACKKSKEKLEMQMEQLALDYEILKQENHEISSRLEQSELQDQLKMQYDCSSSSVIRDLETHIETLEREIEKRADTFELDLAAIVQAKVEQEQRAIRAEEELRKVGWKNANAAERLQDELRRFSLHLSSKFEAHKKLYVQAQAEASELGAQKSHLEELHKKTVEELGSVKDQFKVKLEELLNQNNIKSNKIEQLLLELEAKTEEAEHHNKCSEKRQRALLDEIHKLRTETEVLGKEIEKLKATAHKERNAMLKEQSSDTLKEQHEQRTTGNANQMTISCLHSEIESPRHSCKGALDDLNDMQQLKDRKDIIISFLQLETGSLKSQVSELKHSLSEGKFEKEHHGNQMFPLGSDLWNKEETDACMENDQQNNRARVTVMEHSTESDSDYSLKSSTRSCEPEEVSTLQDINKALVMETELEDTFGKSVRCVQENEKSLRVKTGELEKRAAEMNQVAQSSQEDRHQDNIGDRDRSTSSLKYEDEKTAEARANLYMLEPNADEQITTESALGMIRSHVKICADEGNNTNMFNELASLKEINRSMEKELKEMQERYSQISLKFAEVEGERQQLIMAIRYLKNAKGN